MRRFLEIVIGAAVLFIVLGMLQEYDTFARSWFDPAPKFVASDAERRGAAEAVQVFRTMTAHWYGTGGDRRFEERLPASAALLDELRRDIEYVRRNGRIEVPRLMRIEFLASDVTSDKTAEVRTRELWVTEFQWLAGGTSDAPRSDVIFGRYGLQKDGSRWLIVAWDPVDPPAKDQR